MRFGWRCVLEEGVISASRWWTKVYYLFGDVGYGVHLFGGVAYGAVSVCHVGYRSWWNFLDLVEYPYNPCLYITIIP